MKRFIIFTLTSMQFVIPTVRADTRSQTTIEQKSGFVLTSSVGGVMVRIKRQRDLPNAFGGSDIFGGKISEGFVELRYQGLTNKKNPKFRIVDSQKDSDESTMTRNGNRPQVNVTIGSENANATDFDHDLGEGKEIEF